MLPTISFSQLDKFHYMRCANGRIIPMSFAAYLSFMFHSDKLTFDFTLIESDCELEIEGDGR